MSILYENGEDKTVVLLDIPRSIEESQVLPALLRRRKPPQRRLISSAAVVTAFAVPEPRDGSDDQAASSFPSAQLAELMTLGAVQSALQHLESRYSGPFCLPRIIAETEPPAAESSSCLKRKRPAVTGDAADQDHGPNAQERRPFIPEGSQYLEGTIQDLRGSFLSRAPAFDLIVIDPPWPNRSARRKKGSYATAGSAGAARELLSLIPMASNLAPDGLVAIWVTNRLSFTEMLTSRRGILAGQGLELVDQWTWLKVTTRGEPVFDVGSRSRKPWERLLIARRIGSSVAPIGQRKVIVAVPDVHSRKPNLRGLFEGTLPAGYKGLEIFARNLTAGWWSWGNEVLRFQREEHWVEIEQQSQDPS